MMMKPILFSPVMLLVSLLAVAPNCFSAEWVTGDEISREAAFVAEGGRPKGKSRAMPIMDPEAPLIEVLRPSPLNNLKQPFPVELKFTTRSGAAINPSSLKVSYGFLGLDLTERIRKSATVTPEGLRAENVAIPKGEHRLTVRLADAAGRVGEREIRIQVEE